MELRQFKYVSMVAQCGSFTKAAAKLFISQPALSNYIGKVEEELGVRLFDRSAAPLILTYAGEQYLKRAKAILMQLDDMERELRDITLRQEGRLRLGFPNERIVYMLPIILPPFKAMYPGVEVEVMSGPGIRLMDSLRAGDVDFMFLPQWTKEKGIGQVKVAEEELVLVAARGYLEDRHFLDRERRIVNWREAAKLPLITLNKGHALRSSVDVLFKNAGLRPNIFLESHSNMLSCQLAAQGFGVAVVPEITLEILRGGMEAEAYHLSDPPLTWEICALYREGCYIGQVERDFLKTAAEALAERKTRSGLPAL